MNTVFVIVGSVLSVIVLYYIYMVIRIKFKTIQDNDKIKTLTDQNFQSQIKTGVVLVDFWADRCMPCKMMAPILNSAAEELDGNASVGKLNIEHYQALASKYKVMSIPTMILFKNGKEMNRYVGAKPKDFLLKEIRKYSI